MRKIQRDDGYFCRGRHVQRKSSVPASDTKAVKKVHINKDKLFIDLTPVNFQTRAYKIVLSKSLYKTIKGKTITLKYFDKKNTYKVENKEFEIIV